MHHPRSASSPCLVMLTLKLRVELLTTSLLKSFEASLAIAVEPLGRGLKGQPNHADRGISSHNSSTLVMTWSEKIGGPTLTFFKSDLLNSVLTGSKPLKGSSKMIRWLMDQVMINCTFCWFPFETLGFIGQFPFTWSFPSRSVALTLGAHSFLRRPNSGPAQKS